MRSLSQVLGCKPIPGNGLVILISTRLIFRPLDDKLLRLRAPETRDQRLLTSGGCESVELARSLKYAELLGLESLHATLQLVPEQSIKATETS